MNTVPIRTVAEACYVVASAIVTYAITRLAMWGYPQGRDTIWIVGMVSIVAVVTLGIKPLLTAWAVDHPANGDG
jgi:ABC-type maltose transport system permease subunit